MTFLGCLINYAVVYIAVRKLKEEFVGLFHFTFLIIAIELQKQ